MIKVRIVRGVQLGITGATGLVALSGSVAACAVESTNDEAGADESALTVQNPGTGVFELAWTYGTPTGYSFGLTQSSTDEYVRAREKMTFAVPAHFLWSRLYPTEGLPADTARLQKLSAKIKAVYVRNGAPYASSTVQTTGFRGSQPYDLAATTPPITIGSKAQSVRFEITITDADNPAAKATLGQADFLEVPVFGGTLPNKTLLFDTMGSEMRSRVIEGGKIVAGANVAIGYSDWRAATLVDAGSIDRQIGTAQSFGRFGSFEMPISGELEYEITAAVAIDGAWQAEQPLTANAKSRLMPPFGRTAYEGSIAVPAGAQKVEVYFHVKTFLVVNYDKFSNVKWRKYEQGQRILVRETWDNENGVAYDNWDFTTEKR
jgi:hypothetical protein